MPFLVVLPMAPVRVPSFKILLTNSVTRYSLPNFALPHLGIDSASPEMRMRLSSALDENEQLDSELVGQLVRQARIKSPASSPLKSQNTIEVYFKTFQRCIYTSLLYE